MSHNLSSYTRSWNCKNIEEIGLLSVLIKGLHLVPILWR